MPIYEYQCSKCGVFEVTQRIIEDPLKKCPTCHHKVQKLISNTSFQLKGTGWYITDYGRGSGGEKQDQDSKSNDTSASSDNSNSPATATTKTGGGEELDTHVYSRVELIATFDETGAALLRRLGHRLVDDRRQRSRLRSSPRRFLPARRSRHR